MIGETYLEGRTEAVETAFATLDVCEEKPVTDALRRLFL